MHFILYSPPSVWPTPIRLLIYLSSLSILRGNPLWELQSTDEANTEPSSVRTAPPICASCVSKTPPPTVRNWQRAPKPEIPPQARHHDLAQLPVPKWDNLLTPLPPLSMGTSSASLANLRTMSIRRPTLPRPTTSLSARAPTLLLPKMFPRRSRRSRPIKPKRRKRNTNGKKGRNQVLH